MVVWPLYDSRSWIENATGVKEELRHRATLDAKDQQSMRRAKST